MHRIVTVTLNPSIDRVYVIPDFVAGQMYRSRPAVGAGGKGLNVARLFRTLGGSCAATGFLGAKNGQDVVDSLRETGIENAFITVPGAVRQCQKISDCHGSVTEINEPGPTVGQRECERLLGRLRELLPGARFVVISGSAPPGVEPALIGQMVDLAQHEFGVPAALDTSGRLLSAGIASRPTVVKPNRDELEVFGLGHADAAEAARRIAHSGAAEIALVSDGARGAAAAFGPEVWQAAAPSVRVVNTTGAGDAFLAAFVWSRIWGDDMPSSLRMAVAAGTADVMTALPCSSESQPIFNACSRVTVTDWPGLIKPE